jgi:hypothetical protein
MGQSRRAGKDERTDPLDIDFRVDRRGKRRTVAEDLADLVK